jgi:hypothetical protein
LNHAFPAEQGVISIDQTCGLSLPAHQRPCRIPFATDLDPMLAAESVEPQDLDVSSRFQSLAAGGINVA